MLTDKQCKNASCDAGRPRVRLADSGGLYLEVSPSGSKRWFWKYRFDGKEKRLALGSYPDLGLKEARVARDDARKQHQSGADPVLTRQVERLSSRFDANASFEVTAREFHATKKVGWSDHYAKRWMERLEKDILPLWFQQVGQHFISSCEWHSAATTLAVDADPELNLVRAEFERLPSGSRMRARVQR